MKLIKRLLRFILAPISVRFLERELECASSEEEERKIIRMIARYPGKRALSAIICVAQSNKNALSRYTAILFLSRKRCQRSMEALEYVADHDLWATNAQTASEILADIKQEELECK